MEALRAADGFFGEVEKYSVGIAWRLDNTRKADSEAQRMGEKNMNITNPVDGRYKPYGYQMNG